MVEPVAGCRARRPEACRNKENDLCEMASCARKQESRLGACEDLLYSLGSPK
jgi:hypothetical protein